MTLHLIKLAVGIEKVADLQNRQSHSLKTHGKVFHTTRMMPKRMNELIDGGSLYWVIKRKITVRQLILDIEPFTDTMGIKRCHIHLQPEMILTRPQARRPFQGWRYLPTGDAPLDLLRGVDFPTGSEIDSDMPENMRTELIELGLL